MTIPLIPLGAIYMVAVLLMVTTTRFTLAVPVPPPFWKWRLPEKLLNLHWAWRAVLAGLAIVAALDLGLAGLAGVPESFWSYIRPFYLLGSVAVVASIASQYIGSRAKRVALIAAAAVVALAWYEYPSWLTIDAVSCVLAVYFLLGAQPLVSFWVLAIVELMLAIGYDLVSVFYTSNMLGFAKNIITANLPGLILIPSHLSLSSHFVSAIGVGDVVIPALLVVSAGRLAQRTSCRAIYFWALGGYAVGLLAALLVLALTTTPQPATIFTVPATVAAILFAVYRRNLQSELRAKLSVGPQAHW